MKALRGKMRPALEALRNLKNLRGVLEAQSKKINKKEENHRGVLEFFRNLSETSDKFDGSEGP